MRRPGGDSAVILRVLADSGRADVFREDELLCSGHVLAPGVGAGEALTLDAPLSFWGGTDRATGVIIDRHHPQHGIGIAGRVLIMDASRGSSSSSSVLAEQIRAGVAPAAILLGSRDAIIALGALAAAELYGIRMPVVLINRSCSDRAVRSS